MEVTTDAEGEIEDVNMVPSGPSPTASDGSDQPANKKVSRLSQEARNAREASVDMMAEEKGSNLSENAYRTPQSGLSSSSSVTATSRTSDPSPSHHEPEKLPSMVDQVAKIIQISQTPLFDGLKGYVVCNRWLSDAQELATNAHKSSKDAQNDIVKPVDNRHLVDTSYSNLADDKGDKFYPLKPGLVVNQEIEIIPKEAWDLIVKWHGVHSDSPEIVRHCHNTNNNPGLESLQFELYPPVFTVMKLPDLSGGITFDTLKEKETTPVKIVSSRQDLFQSFLKRAKSAAGIEENRKVRVWRIIGTLTGGTAQPGMLTPAHSRSNSPAPHTLEPTDLGNKLVLDVNTFLGLQEGSQRELIDVKDETMNSNYNGHSNLDLVGLGMEGIIVLEEQIGGPAGGEWVSDNARANAAKNGFNRGLGFGNSLKPKSASASGRSSPVPGGMMTRGRAQRSGKTPGTVGLGNLGNSCYMNSALQCVRSVQELSFYFLREFYKRELNPQNPLGCGGNVAKAYASLLNELYDSNPSSSFSPRQFKQTIGRYGASFSGYGQQDSQEFLLFLLDGLQEDLNRIQQKPYIEKPDSTDEMVHDKKALQDMADTCWEIYKKRNDSVITDLFAGMYKSTLVCPECDKVSIVFDPFTNLTLQLPIENLWSRVIYFFPLYQPPIKIDVDIDKHATFFNLKEYIGNKTGVDPKKMVISEIYKCKFFKMFDDKLALANENLAENDMICIFELDMVPTNYPAPKKKAQKIRSLLNYNNSDEEEDVPEGDSALAERMLVPVFHRAQKPAGARSQHRQLFGNPSYIVLTRDEAQDEDSILRKALENAQALTTLNILTEKGDESDDAGSDTVIMNPEDANSSPGSKVQASSVQSEDGMVDISMPDAAKSASLHVSYPADTDPESRKPRRLKPGSFILPASRQLFEMKYMKGSEMIPTGWNALHDDTKDFPLLSSRLPQPERRRRAKPHGSSAAEKLKRRIANSGSGSDSSDGETDDPPPPAVPQPSAAMSHDGGDSSEDDGFPEVEELVNSSNKGFGRFDRSTPRNKFGLITYGRKAKAKAPQRFAGEDDDMQDDEETSAKVPLIRLGEALILDWKIDLDNSLFQSPRFRHFEDDGGFRGFNTWDNVPLLPDEELVTKRMHRAARRKDGVTLEDCLDEYNKAEILSKDDAWYCPRCKEHRRASKKLELWKVPDILVIHLKRFSAHGRFRDKLDLFVEFPVEGLGLTSRVAVNEDGKELIYDLFAVDNHYGGLGGGHYTAYAKNMVDEQWYDYNDSMVSRKSNPRSVVTSAAYLLFYRRRADHPLGGPFFDQIYREEEANDANEVPSQPTSRTQSPSGQAGEGQRLGVSSRGSSSALLGAGAGRQAGNGGLGVRSLIGPKNDVDEDLPSYSEIDPHADAPIQSTEEDDSHPNTFNIHSEPNWSFAGRTTLHDEGMGDDASISSSRAASLGGSSTKSMNSGMGWTGNDFHHNGTPDIVDMEDEDIPMLAQAPDFDDLAQQFVVGADDQEMLAGATEDDEKVAEVRLDDSGDGMKE